MNLSIIGLGVAGRAKIAYLG